MAVVSGWPAITGAAARRGSPVIVPAGLAVSAVAYLGIAAGIRRRSAVSAP